jgi:hypothetical protein
MHLLKDKQTKWGLWSMRKCAQKRGLTVDQFFQDIAKLAEGNEVTVDYLLGLVADMIWAAHLHATGKELTEQEVFDLIDECGGIAAVNGEELNGFLNYVAGTMANGATKEEGEGDKKKE